MTKLQFSLKHTKALIKAFQRPAQVRCFKAPPAVVDGGQFVSKDPQCLLSSPRYRWTTTMSLIPRGATPVQVFGLHSTSAFSFSTAATPQVDGKDSSPTPSSESTSTATEEVVEPVEAAVSAEQKGGTKPVADEDSDTEDSDKEDIGKEDLAAILREKLALLEHKNKEVRELKDKVLWTLAEMENVRARTKREADSSRKFAIQSFAKELLDVADNLSRAMAAVPEGIIKANPADDPSGNLKVLQTLAQGVEMTEKQLLQVFKKHRLEKYVSLGEQFDPNRHSAVFELEDKTKPAGSVAMELKVGYILNDRVIRPAEVGVVKE